MIMRSRDATRSGDVVMPVSALCSSLARAGGSVSLKNATTLPLQSGYQRSVCRVPCAVTLISYSESVCYYELRVRISTCAQLLLHTITGKRSTADWSIGLCLNKSVAMLVGMLGVLVSGAAYIPLDPTYPAKRSVAISQDASFGGLVIAESSGTRYFVQLSSSVIYKKAWWSSGGRSMSYMIYTSSSTGLPKGVVLEHVNSQHFVGVAKEI